MPTRGYLKEHSGILLWVMRLLDIMVSLVFCLLAYYLVFGPLPLPSHYLVAILFSIILTMLVFQAYSLYRTWRGVDYMQEIAAVIMAWTTVFAIQAFLSVVTKTSADYSRAWLLMWYAFGGIGLLLVRYLLRRVLRYLRSQGFNLRHIVIIAAGDIGGRVLENLESSSESGFKVSGYFSDETATDRFRKNGTNDHIEYGPVPHAKQYLETHQIDQVWIAMPMREADRIESIMTDLRNCTADIRLVPDVFGFRLLNHSVSAIAGLPVINLSVTPMEGLNVWIKAVEDKLISIAILLLSSPLLLCIAVAIKLTSPGPVLYRQNRLSWNSKEFEMYKFRTMPVNVEANSGPVWASQGEQRATPVGKLLRRTSLDELPQFWNVLNGDMSIVGPRPERPVFVNELKDKIPSYMQKHMVKAGITGWAQVNGWRGDTDLVKRIEHDLYYIENWSLWLDLKIMLLTVFRGFINKNAY
jgi:putative colanic acid biosynthesis UDP-glucose lipid carrier transferase